MDQNQTNQAKHRPDRTSLGLLIGFTVLAIVAAVVSFYEIRNIIETWNLTTLPGVSATLVSSSNPTQVSPATTGTVNTTPAPTSSNLLMPGPTAVPWDGASRVNILMMGLDYGDWGDRSNASGAARTDSMILFTIDPVSKTAGMMSIPRDMWVNIPGFDYGPINTAYFLGDAFKMPGGGPGLAVATVEEFLGVPIQYYAQIDFNAFAKFIDEMGGVTINVPDTMHLSLIGNPTMFEIKPGVQTLDGPTLLAYARDRHDDATGGYTDDYARSLRQQQVIMAIRDQILQAKMLPTLIAKAPAMFQDLSSGIRTNLQLDQVIKLAELASTIDTSKIKRGLIDEHSVINAMAVLSDGTNKAVLVPIPEKISAIRDEVFTISSSIKPGAGTNQAALIKNEKTRITIQNGTGQPGLAARTVEYLKAQGLNVVEQTDSAQPQSSSSIIIYTGKPYTIRYLTSLLKIQDANIINKFNADSPVDIELVLGSDWANKNPMP
jgi:polyisoprenyl-teichoic acid--peptidoglycan teichoic acid transferase